MPNKIIITDEIAQDVLKTGTSFDEVLNAKYADEIADRRAKDDRYKNMTPVKMAMIDAGIFGNSLIKDMFKQGSDEFLFPAYWESKLRESLLATDIMQYVVSGEIGVPSTVVKNATLDLLSTANQSNVKKLRVEEGADLPLAKLTTGQGAINLFKKGRAVEATYEALMFWRVDLMSKLITAIANDVAQQNLEDAINVLLYGDGNNNPAEVLDSATATADTVTAAEFVEACVDYYFKYKLPPTTAIAPDKFFKSLAGLTYDRDKAFGASGRVSITIPQIGDMQIKLLHGDVPKTSGNKNQILLFNKDYALNRYVANGSRIQETAKTILNQKELATVSEISGYGKFMQCVGTIVSA